MIDHSPNSPGSFWDAPRTAEKPAGFPWRRVRLGAAYGFVLGALYTLVAGTIDVAVLRDLPLRVDWPALWGAVMAAGLGAALLAAIVAWPEEPWRGVVIGAVAITAWSMLQSISRVQAAALAFVPLFLPLAAMSLPIAGVMRWMVQRHAANMERRGPGRLRAQAVLFLMVLVVGSFAGSWSKMPPEAEEAVRKVHRALARALAAPAGTPLPTPFRDVPEVLAHAVAPYALDQRPSLASPLGVDVRVMFADGYVMTCLVDPGTSLFTCLEGDRSLFGASQFDPNDQR